MSARKLKITFLFSALLVAQGAFAQVTPISGRVAIAATPAQRVSGGLDYVYGQPSTNSLEECKTTYSPANQNAMFYRRENGGVTDLKIIDNVKGITQTIPVGAPGDAFLAASDLGDNFARTYLETIKRVYYTTDSGTTWHTLVLPTSAQHATNWGVEWMYQMFFGPDGKLYVVYFTENTNANYVNRGQLNLFVVPRTTSGTPVGQHYVLSTFDAGAQLGSNRFVSAVAMANQLAIVYNPGMQWTDSFGFQSDVPRWYTLAWGANPLTQGQHGWIGDDAMSTCWLQGNCYSTNIDKIWLATDGGVLYTLSTGRALTGGGTERIVQKITLTGGALPDTGPGFPAAPLTQLTAMPGTDISAVLGDMTYNPTVKGPINYFDAIKITNPTKWGGKGPNVAFVAKDAFGYADFKNFMVLNVKNPANGTIGWVQRKNDVTEQMLAPGHVQEITEAGGFDHSVTGINGAMVYTFCRTVINGNFIGYHTTDISK